MDVARTAVVRYYRPELDVVRMLAFLCVFLYHAIPAGVGPLVVTVIKVRGLSTFLDLSVSTFRYGLSLFFTLSAFLIVELLIREREGTGTVAVKQFYLRRILRIWPLYYLVLALGVGFAMLPIGHRDSISTLGWYAVFMGSWYSVVRGWAHNPAGPLWSISVEEQFYLFAPWAAKYLSRINLFGFCAILIAIANAWIYYLGAKSAENHVIWGNAFIQFECFAAGILLCLILRGRIPKIALGYRAVLFACSWLSWFAAAYVEQVHPGGITLMMSYALSSVGSVLVLLSFLGVSPKLLPGWAIYMGRISFGLYAYHGFGGAIAHQLLSDTFVHSSGLVYFMDSLLSLGLTMLTAMLSYRYFETPFLKMKKRHSVIQSQPVRGES